MDSFLEKMEICEPIYEKYEPAITKRQAIDQSETRQQQEQLDNKAVPPVVAATSTSSTKTTPMRA